MAVIDQAQPSAVSRALEGQALVLWPRGRRLSLGLGLTIAAAASILLWIGLFWFALRLFGR